MQEDRIKKALKFSMILFQIMFFIAIYCLLKDFCLGACGCPALPGNIYRGSVFVSMSHCPLLRGDLRVRGIFRIEKNGVQSSKN